MYRHGLSSWDYGQNQYDIKRARLEKIPDHGLTYDMGLGAKKFTPVNPSCNREIIYLKDLLNNKDLINIINKELLKLINKLKDNGVNMEYLTSNSLFTGNIGKGRGKINYIISSHSNIREKVNAITNTFYNAEDGQPIMSTSRILYKYIMTKKGNCKFLYKAIQTVTKNKNPEKLFNKPYIEKEKNIYSLWCPIFNIYPGFIYSKNKLGTFSNMIKDVKDKRSLTIKEFIEPLSDMEKKFLTKKGIDLKGDVLNILIGRDVYGDKIKQLINTTELDTCRVAGVSGHAILHLTLGFIFNMDLKCIFLALLFEMVPIHHSIEEIYFALHDLEYMLNCEKKIIGIELHDNQESMLKFITKIIVNGITKTSRKTLKKRSKRKRKKYLTKKR